MGSFKYYQLELTRLNYDINQLTRRIEGLKKRLRYASAYGVRPLHIEQSISELMEERRNLRKELTKLKRRHSG